MRHKDLISALEALGLLLEAQGEVHEIVLIGGGALLLVGLIDRPTRDLDIVARVDGARWVEGEPMPALLAAAIRDVGRALDLADDWLNAGPTDLLRFGLPEGFAERTTALRFGGLGLRLASRLDQVAFKLYATVDQGPRSKHLKDLRHLNPTPDELLWAARWCRTHDPSDGFREMLTQALSILGVEGAHV